MKEKVMEVLKIGLLSFAVTLVMVAVAITMENNREVSRDEIAAAITSYEPDNPRFNYDCQDKICDVSTLSMEYIVDCNEECIVIQDSERFH